MRVVGLLMLALGLLIGWEVIQGRDPRTHLFQLLNLVFHSNLTVPSSVPPTTAWSTGISGFAPGAGVGQGAAGGGGGAW